MITLLQPHIVPASDLSMMSGPRIFFWLFASLTVVGSFMTIMSRNMVGAVMWLVATFFGFAALFAMLDAHFLAALQVLVYAGAIMVLFIFVVMVLNRDELERFSWRSWPSKALGVFTLVLMAFAIGYYAKEQSPASFQNAAASFGTVAEVGQVLFTDYIFAFEAVSVLLLIAVIAAVVVARTHKHENPADIHHAEQLEAAHAHHDHAHAEPAPAAHGGH